MDSSSLEGTRILIVDLDGPSRQRLRDALIAAGHSVVTAGDRSQLGKLGRFDLLIVDLVERGQPWLVALTDADPSMPVLYMADAIGPGRVVISKPFDDLALTVEQVDGALLHARRQQQAQESIRRLRLRLSRKRA
ncbi:MAG: hypothetical protein AAFX94_04245 [Myxococcota bacterium]